MFTYRISARRYPSMDKKIKRIGVLTSGGDSPA